MTDEQDDSGSDVCPAPLEATRPRAEPIVRPCTVADVERAQEIERDAGMLFLEVGMPEIAEDEPLDRDTLAGYAEAGRAWVLLQNGEVVAYVLAAVIDGHAHVDQLSIIRHASGQGLGAMLLRHVEGWAGRQGLRRLTFTTFRDVPWNAPYYARLGFAEISEDTIGPELAAIVAEERHLDAGRWPRIVMAAPIATTSVDRPAT